MLQIAAALLVRGSGMPTDFPDVPHKAVIERMAAKRDAHTHAVNQCLAGWNGVAYRYRSCTEHDEAFTRLIEREGNIARSQESIYQQQNELFGFFVAGQAAIESFCFGLFTFASIASPSNFPIATPANLRGINPGSTAQRFASAFPKETITARLDQLVSSPEFKEWADVRNLLIHRLSPPRQIDTGGVSWGQGVWDNNISIDAGTTASRRRWLNRTLTDLLTATDTFTGNDPALR